MNDEWSEDLSEMVDELAEEDYDPMEARGRGRGGRSRVITLLPKRAFDYSFLTATTASVVLKRAIRVVPYFYYTLMVRIHELNIEHASSYYKVEAYNTLPSKQDPTEFSIGSPILTATISDADSAGGLELVKTNDQGAFFKVLLNINQGAAGNRLYAELSAVLLCRPVG